MAFTAPLSQISCSNLLHNLHGTCPMCLLDLVLVILSSRKSLTTCSPKRLLFILQTSTRVPNHLEKLPWPPPFHSFVTSFTQLFSEYPLYARHGARHVIQNQYSIWPHSIRLSDRDAHWTSFVNKCRIIDCNGFPCSSVGEEYACSAGDLGLIPGSGRSPGEGNGNPLQYSCLEYPHGQRSLAGYSPWRRKSWTQLGN